MAIKQMTIRRTPTSTLCIIPVYDGRWRFGTMSELEQNLLSWLQKWLGETNRNAKIGTAKTPDDGKRHANDFSIAIEERSAGAARSGLRIVDNFVRKDVADMALSDQRANELAAQEFVDDLLRFSAGALGDFAYGIFPGSRENGADARGIAEREQRLATDGRLFASIQFEDGPFQARQITFEHGEVRYFGNLRNADGNACSRIGKIGS